MLSPPAVPAADEALFERYCADRDDRAARDELVVRHLPLARRIARRYRNSREPIEDLEQVAALALVKAIDRFDPARGTPFRAYAGPTISGEIKRHLRDTTWAVRPSRRVQELAVQVAAVRDELSGELGHPPPTAAVADRLGCTTEEVIEGFLALLDYRAVSLDAELSATDDTALVDQIGADDERYEYLDAALSIAPALQRLPARERHLLALRFQHDLTQTEISEREGVTQMQVSRLLRLALSRLRAIVEGPPTSGARLAA